MGWLRARLREPSTFAGVATVLQGLKVFFPLWGAVIDGVTMATGAAAVAMREKGTHPAPIEERRVAVE